MSSPLGKDEKEYGLRPAAYVLSAASRSMSLFGARSLAWTLPPPFCPLLIRVRCAMARMRETEFEGAARGRSVVFETAFSRAVDGCYCSLGQSLGRNGAGPRTDRPAKDLSDISSKSLW